MARVIPILPISCVFNSLLSSEEARTLQCITITNKNTFTDRVPAEGGIMDPRMGTVEHEYMCKTCFNEKTNCPGHPGMIDLTIPLIHALYYDSVVKWLKHICLNCGSSIDGFPLSVQINPAGRKCSKCGSIHPKVLSKKESSGAKNGYVKILDMSTSKPGGEPEILYPAAIAKIFDKVTMATVMEVGANINAHPSKYIVHEILVPSVTIRSDIKILGSSSKNTNNNITRSLHTLQSINLGLKTIVGTGTAAAAAASTTAVSTLPIKGRKKSTKANDISAERFNQAYQKFLLSSESSETQGLGDRVMQDEEELKTSAVLKRIVGKLGLIRHRMQSKPVTHIARAVIAENHKLNLNQAEYPLEFAKVLWIAETVQPYNIGKLMIFFENGRQNKYPGCAFIETKEADGKYVRRKVTALTNYNLKFGDRVLRNLVTGDTTLFGRHPSLWYASCQVMRMIIDDDPHSYSIKMNVISCPPFGADFDGDQMWIITPSKPSTIIESRVTMSLENNVISWKDCSPMFSQWQDSIVGGFLLTREKTVIDKYHSMMIFNNVISVNPIFEKSQYTGRELVSKIFPKFNFSCRPAWADDVYVRYTNCPVSERRLEIRNGEVISGVIDNSSNNLYTIICSEKGNMATVNTLYNFQQIAIEFLTLRGFTVGVKDFIVNDDTQKNIALETGKILLQSHEINKRLLNNEIIPPLGKTVEEYYEEQQINTLRPQYMSVIMPAIDHNNNNLLFMIAPGSRGSPIHFASIIAAVGQQIIKGKRIMQSFSYMRSCAFFPRYSLDPKSRGLISHSLAAGLTTSEFIFNAMTARIDLIAKTKGTADAGEQGRIVNKNLESDFIDNFRSVVRENGMVQLLFAGTGFDCRKLEMVEFPSIMSDDDTFEKEYHYSPEDKKLKAIFDDEFTELKNNRALYRKTMLQVEGISIELKFTSKKLSPINVDQIMKNAIFYGEQNGLNENITEKDIADMLLIIKDFCDNLAYIYQNSTQRERKSFVPPHHKSGLIFITMLIKFVLSTKNLKKVQPIILKKILIDIENKLRSSLIEYGTPIGLLYGGCFSEPMTQASLKAIHKGANIVTTKEGLPRVKEIIGISSTKKVVEPRSYIQIKPEVSKERADEIVNYIGTRKLKDFILSSQIFWEKYGEPLHPDYVEEKQIFKDFERKFGIHPTNLMSWCIRIELDRYEMILKNITLENILDKLYDPDIHIVYTNENSKKLVLRFYYKFDKINDNKAAFEEELDRLLDVVVRGIEGIVRAKLIEKFTRYVINPNGSMSISDKVMIIETIGVNLYGIYALQDKFPELDYTTLWTDDIHETFDIFGLMATRQRIINELKGALKKPNYTIHMLIADEMVQSGKLLGITRQSVQKRVPNFQLHLATAGQIKLIKSQVPNIAKGRTDSLSAALMVGQVPKIGTGYNTFVLDEKFIDLYNRTQTL